MMWTQKEASLLQDLKTQEQVCVDKYARYAQDARDPELRQLFDQIGQNERQHLQWVDTMLQGNMPQMNQAGQAQQNASPNPPPKYNVPQTPDKQHDAYLCQDALGTEKHVSSVYDVSVFEFRAPEARQVLNTLQSQEQHHGEQLYAYMARNGMMQ